MPVWDTLLTAAKLVNWAEQELGKGRELPTAVQDELAVLHGVFGGWLQMEGKE